MGSRCRQGAPSGDLAPRSRRARCQQTRSRLWLDGTIETLATGSWQPRGIASDGDRAFVSIRRSGHLRVFRI